MDPSPRGHPDLPQSLDNSNEYSDEGNNSYEEDKKSSNECNNSSDNKLGKLKTTYAW